MSLFKKTMQRGARVSVIGTEQRISLARILRNKDNYPLLDLCQIKESRNMALRQDELKSLAKQKGIDRQSCSTLMPFGHYQLLVVDAPKVKDEEMKSAVRWKIKDLIDFDIENAIVDIFPIPDQKSSAKVYVVVAQKDSVQKLVKQIAVAGFQVDTVDIPEMAMRNICSLIPEDVAGIAMLYLDVHCGLITMSRQSNLYLSRHIEIGFEEFQNLGKAASSESIKHYADKIVIELQRSLDYFESNFSLAAISNVLLAPTPLVIPEIDHYIQNQLGVNCRYLDMNTLIDMDEPMDQQTQWASFLSIGSALRVQEAA